MAINGSPILFAFAHMKQRCAQSLSSLQYYYQLSFSGKHPFSVKKKKKKEILPFIAPYIILIKTLGK